MRNAMDAEEIAIGWWPGDGRYPRAAFYAYAFPPREGVAGAQIVPPGAHWDANLGEFILDWDDVIAAEDPQQAALDFARSFARHACAVCGWDDGLARTLDGVPPPVE
jgi:hypothetical protein